MGGVDYEIALWDTAGQDEYKALRSMAYQDANVVMMCFSIDLPDSLDNTWEKVSSQLKS